MENVNIENVNRWKDAAFNFLVERGPGVLMAIITLVVGFWVIARVLRIMRKAMDKRGVDESLIPFLLSTTSIALKTLLIISVAGMVGIATTSFVAVLGAAGLAVGLALQGSLGNFAGGVLILAFKPYRVGDLIQAQGEIGVVKSITIFNTIISTPRGNTTYLPNGAVANDKLTNFFHQPFVRVDMVVGISYGSSIKEARKVILEALKSVPQVVNEPTPFVGVLELGDSSVNLAVRPHCKAEEYWDCHFACMEAVKEALDNAGIEIPFPQRDLHVKSGSLA